MYRQSLIGITLIAFFPLVNTEQLHLLIYLLINVIDFITTTQLYQS